MQNPYFPYIDNSVKHMQYGHNWYVLNDKEGRMHDCELQSPYPMLS